VKRRLLWKFLLIIATGAVALFYLIDHFASVTEEGMSRLDEAYQQEMTAWGREAEALYQTGNIEALNLWIDELQLREDTQAAVVQMAVQRLAGNQLNEDAYTGYNFGRPVFIPIHLYFAHNPLMEVPFEQENASLVLVLPDRMRPGSYWNTVRILLHVFLPLVLLGILVVLLYRHIMQPLRKLERAAKDLSQGNLSVRVSHSLGNRNDELSELANTFDQMAARIGELIVSQRQLIADLSHELRTPLTRLEMAVDNARGKQTGDLNLQRVHRESQHIRRLVEDTLTLAWLENERPMLEHEDLDLVDLIDVIVDDARFEFPDRQIITRLPDSAELKRSNHRAVGQALENIVRNALRFTQEGEAVEVDLLYAADAYRVTIKDRGPGVPEPLLETIFQPFYRVDQSRASDSSSFGLGLSLAQRQLKAVGGRISASNRAAGGLCMSIMLPAA